MDVVLRQRNVRVALLTSRRTSYIIRASFSQERMRYLAMKERSSMPQKTQRPEVLRRRGWLAAMCSHVRIAVSRMVRYYGWYSNFCGANGRRKIQRSHPLHHQIRQDSGSMPEKLGQAVQKIYEVDPLACPKCRVYAGSSASSR